MSTGKLWVASQRFLFGQRSLHLTKRSSAWLVCLSLGLMIWLWPGSLAQKLKPLPNAERHQMRLNDAPTVNNVDSGNRISLANSHEPGTHLNEQFFVGRVLAVTPLRVNGQLMQATGMVSRQQLVTVTVAEGPLKGITAKVINEVTDNPAFNVEVKPGQEVILSLVSGGSGETEINIADYNRAPALLILLAVFLVVFLVLGGKTGLKSLAGLAISVFLIVAVLLPLSLKGVYPLATAVGICIVAAVASMLFVAGFSAKALAAIVGIVGGVVISGIASSLTIAFAPLTGLSSEEAQILRGSVLGLPASFYSGLLAAGMLIGALGVIMDVAISIASSVREIANANRDLPLQVLYSSGMNIGKDIMGTMTNTLVLAYVGSALPLLLLTSQMPASKLVNLDIFATEIAASLCGSLGLICTIPLTAIAAAALMAKRLQGDSDGQGNENSRENSDAKASLNSTFKKDVEDREIEQSLAGVDLFKTDLSRQSQDTGS